MKNAYKNAKQPILGWMICFCLLSTIGTAVAGELLFYQQAPSARVKLEGTVLSLEDGTPLRFLLNDMISANHISRPTMA